MRSSTSSMARGLMSEIRGEMKGGNIKVHLDSAAPFGRFLGTNPAGLLVHFGRDVVGGELFTPEGVSH
jgi:hypothetical protein